MCSLRPRMRTAHLWPLPPAAKSRSMQWNPIPASKPLLSLYDCAKDATCASLASENFRHKGAALLQQVRCDSERSQQQLCLYVFIQVMQASHVGCTITYHQLRLVTLEVRDDLRRWVGICMRGHACGSIHVGIRRCTCAHVAVHMWGCGGTHACMWQYTRWDVAVHLCACDGTHVGMRMQIDAGGYVRIWMQGNTSMEGIYAYTSTRMQGIIIYVDLLLP